MTKEVKILGALGILTLVLIVGGAILMGNNAPGGNTEPQVVQSQLAVDYAPSRGNKEAKVALVEFSDYQCPACKAAYQDVERIVEEYGDQIFFVYRQFPLQIHKNAKVASYAALAAQMQGKYWEMHLKLFDKQEEWSDHSNARDKFADYAKELNLDVEKFKSDMNSNDVYSTVENEITEGIKIGINSTPSFFINGQKYPGVLTYNQMKSIIDSELSSE